VTLEELKARAGGTVNYRYLAYALTQGCATVDEVFAQDGSNVGFMGFISRCRADAQQARGWKDSHAPIPADELDAVIVARLSETPL
jgi:hypothetical protein